MAKGKSELYQNPRWFKTQRTGRSLRGTNAHSDWQQSDCLRIGSLCTTKDGSSDQRRRYHRLRKI